METPEINIEIPKAKKTQPILLQERIENLDVIRGLALLGILIVNLAMFSSPWEQLWFLGKNLWPGLWDTATSSFISTLIQGKFYTMFSLLFGLGFFMFFERAKEKVAKPKWLFCKRLFILLLIGLIHGFFIWYGDILVMYALIGFLLPLFFNVNPKKLLIWAGSIFLVFIAFMALIFGVLSLLDESIRAELVAPALADLQSQADASFLAYGHGTFADIMAQRVSDMLTNLGSIPMGAFVIFPLFLIGLYVGKKGVFQNIEENLRFIKKVWIWGLAIGLPLSFVKFMIGNLIAGDPFSIFLVLHIGIGFFADLGIALFLITSIVLLSRKKSWLLRLKPLAATGRMALSNYLFQSIVCTLIFYNYGLGFYGQVGPALLLVLAIVIFTIQIFISNLWMKRYQFGPVEWLWKCLTYGKVFRLRSTPE